jgi:hypothetical protein
VMQMLGAAKIPLLVDRIRVADPDNPRGYFEFEPVKGLARDSSFFADAVGKGIKVVAPLLRFLPDAYRYAVVFIERPMAAVLASQRVMLSRLSDGESSNVDAVNEEALHQAFEKSLGASKAWLSAASNADVLYVKHPTTPAESVEMAEAIVGFSSQFWDVADFGVGSLRDAPGRSALVKGMAAVVDPSLNRQGRS